MNVKSSTPFYVPDQLHGIDYLTPMNKWYFSDKFQR